MDAVSVGATAHAANNFPDLCVKAAVKATTMVLGLALAGGAAAAVGTVLAEPSPAKRVCERVRTLCGKDFDVGACERDFEGEKAAGLADATACVEPAENCIEVVACLGGAALRDLGDGFVRGLLGTD